MSSVSAGTKKLGKGKAILLLFTLFCCLACVQRTGGGGLYRLGGSTGSLFNRLASKTTSERMIIMKVTLLDVSSF